MTAQYTPVFGKSSPLRKYPLTMPFDFYKLAKINNATGEQMETIDKSMAQTDEVIQICKETQAMLEKAQAMLEKALAQRDELLAGLEAIAKGYSGSAGNMQGLSGTDCAEIARAALAKVPK